MGTKRTDAGHQAGHRAGHRTSWTPSNNRNRQIGYTHQPQLRRTHNLRQQLTQLPSDQPAPGRPGRRRNPARCEATLVPEHRAPYPCGPLSHAPQLVTCKLLRATKTPRLRRMDNNASMHRHLRLSLLSFHCRHSRLTTVTLLFLPVPHRPHRRTTQWSHHLEHACPA